MARSMTRAIGSVSADDDRLLQSEYCTWERDMRHRKKYNRDAKPKPKKRAPGISRRLSAFIEDVEIGTIRPVAGFLQDASAAWDGMTLKERLAALANLSHSSNARHALVALERAEKRDAGSNPRNPEIDPTSLTSLSVMNLNPMAHVAEARLRASKR